jgi:hypothetical protein
MLFGAAGDLEADVNLDGEAYRVTMPRPNGPDACVWALADDWSPLFPGNLPDEQRAYWTDRLEDPDDPLERAHLRPVAFRLAKQVYGVSWWAAHRITEEAAEGHLMWQAWCVRHGFSPAGEGADRIIASIVGWITAGFEDPAQLKSWQTRTFMRPAGVREG